MPCSDSSSSITLFLDKDERFKRFEYAKITCGSEITGGTGYSKYCQEKDLSEILKIPFTQVNQDLTPKDEESQFVLYLEWDALRSAIAQYLGIDDPDIDKDRCQITSIDSTEEGTEIALVILPPKELPKIVSCSVRQSSAVSPQSSGKTTKAES